MKKTLKWFFLFFLALNLGLLATGKWYYWKALFYNYVNIDDLELFPYRIIEAGQPQPWPLASAYNQIQITDSLRKELEDFKTVAFLVIKDDSILIERYWENYSAHSYSNSFSMAKSVVGILTGMALDEGKIKSLEQPVSDFIPEFKNPPDNNLTVYHLLTMSAELNWDESYSSLTSETTEAYYGKNLRKQMLRLKTTGPAGVHFNYQSACTQLLGMVLEKATGKTLSEYASEKLWKPIGAESEARWSLDRKDGMEKAYCCIYSNARDFARIGKLYLDSGRWNGHQLVSQEYVLNSIKPAALTNNGQPNKEYGYQWWIGEYSGHRVFYARGILGQYIIVLPEEKMIIVRLGHLRDKDELGNLRDVSVYIHELSGMLQLKKN
jgi:CubicO group peptidase (beta-lactamase class C family)